MTTRTDKPGWGERICYGAGGLGIRLVFTAVTGYLLIYLTNVALLDIAACSAIIGVSKFLDGISDVLIGNIIDKTEAKLGRARTWMLRMCLPFAVTMLLLFWVPAGFPQLVKYVYVFLMYNIVNSVMFTFMLLSHLSMVSLISADKEDQVVLSSVQGLARGIGTLIGSVTFVRFLSFFTDEPGNQNTQAAYTRTLILFCSVMLILTLISVAGIRERVKTAVPREKKSLLKESFDSLGVLLKNKYWRVLIICDLLINIVSQFMATGATYYSLYVLNDMNKLSLILMSNMIPSIIIMLAMPALNKKTGSRRLFITGLVISIAGLAGFGLAAPSLTPMLMFNALYGVGNGIFKSMTVVLTAELIKYTDKTTGQLIAGAGNAGISATDKLGCGLGNAFYGFILAAAGFNAALKVQPASVVTAVSALFIWIPLAMFTTVLVIFALFFDLERNTAE